LLTRGLATSGLACDVVWSVSHETFPFRTVTATRMMTTRTATVRIWEQHGNLRAVCLVLAMIDEFLLMDLIDFW
jgi:hypothetical protein